MVIQGLEKPEKPDIVLYNPPEGVTPALARLIWCGKYDLKVFCTAIVTLAAKGWINIQKTENGPELSFAKSGKPLCAREEILFNRLFRGREKMLIDRTVYLDLRDAQKQHFDALMDEDTEYFYSPYIGGSSFFELIIGWLWPYKLKQTKQLREQIEGYRQYLRIAMKSRLDPVFQPGGELNDVCTAMPYIIAFDIENSWADYFVGSISSMLDSTPYTTSLYDLGDAAMKRSRRQRRYLKNIK